MNYFYNFNELPYKKKRDRAFFKSITGVNAQICIGKLEPGEETLHFHEYEQLGYVLSGKVQITIDDNTKILGPNEGYRIPSNVKHGFRVLSDEALEYIEIFSPPKEENRY